MALHIEALPLKARRRSPENTQETDALIVGLSQAVQSNQRFEEDRPLLQAMNHRGGIPRLLENLSIEINELCAQEFDGAWAAATSDVSTRLEYQRQEIADVFIFSLGGLMRLGYDADDVPMAKLVQAVSRKKHDLQTQAIFQADSARVRSPRRPTLESFPEITHQIQFWQRQFPALAAAAREKVTPELRSQLADIFQQLVRNSILSYQVLGLDAAEAINEKIARNIVKYPAHLLQMPLSLGSQSLEQHYRQQVTLCKQQFATNSIQPRDQRLRPKAEWGHLDKGTQAFYSIARSI